MRILTLGMSFSGYLCCKANSRDHLLSLLESGERCSEHDVLLISGDDVVGTLDLLRELGSMGIEMPVVVFMGGTGNTPCNRAKALLAGADYCMWAPVPTELEAFLIAFRRRANGVSGNVLTVGDLSLNRRTGNFYRRGRRIDLRPKELTVLTMLVENAGSTVSKDSIFRTLYPDLDPEEDRKDTIKVFICHLRKKMGSSPKGGPYIETVSGGYRIPNGE